MVAFAQFSFNVEGTATPVLLGFGITNALTVRLQPLQLRGALHRRCYLRALFGAHCSVQSSLQSQLRCWGCGQGGSYKQTLLASAGSCTARCFAGGAVRELHDGVHADPEQHPPHLLVPGQRGRAGRLCLPVPRVRAQVCVCVCVCVCVPACQAGSLCASQVWVRAGSRQLCQRLMRGPISALAIHTVRAMPDLRCLKSPLPCGSCSPCVRSHLKALTMLQVSGGRQATGAAAQLSGALGLLLPLLLAQGPLHVLRRRAALCALTSLQLGLLYLSTACFRSLSKRTQLMRHLSALAACSLASGAAEL